MAKSRMINTRFWIDDYIGNLDPIEKLLFLYFLTNPATDICGVYELPLKNVALDTGIEKEMVIKILGRFDRDMKIFYRNGWVGIKNFVKHQSLNPQVKKGIEIGLAKAPKEILDSLLVGSDSLSHLNSNLNLNTNRITASPPDIKISPTEKKEDESEKIFDLSEELKKLEISPRRELRIIGWFVYKKKVSLKNKGQLSATIKRHLRAAVSLKSFEVKQINSAAYEAEKDIGNKWTLETINKILTK